MLENTTLSDEDKENKVGVGAKPGIASGFESAQDVACAFAEHAGHNLRAFLGCEALAKEVQRQWEHSQQAVLPLVFLGHEENPQDLWNVVRRLDPRYQDYPDAEEDEALSMRRLESALDSCAAQIIERAKTDITCQYPSIGLTQRLIGGFWCIAALLPRGSWSPPAKPEQLFLF